MRGSPINKKRVSKGAGVKGAMQKATATFPPHLMATPDTGSMPTSADAEMKRLMQNKGTPRKKVS